MDKRYLTLLITLLLTCLRTTAQDEILSFRLTTANGLPDNDIRTIMQDANGMLYFNTQYGTYMFDGYNFRETERRTPGETAANSGNVNRKDNRGNTYRFDTNGSLTYTDRNTHKTLRIQIFNPRQLQLSKMLKVHVITDAHDMIWVSVYGNGLFIYDKKNGQVRHITKGDKNSPIDTDDLQYLYEDRTGNIWVAQNHYGLVCLKVERSGCQILDFGTNGERTNDIRMMQRTADGTIYFCDNAGNLYSAGGSLQAPKPIGSGRNILTAFTDSRGTLWIGSRQDGMRKAGEWLGTGRIETFAEDNAGRIWATGLHNDIYVNGRALDVPRYGFRQFAVCRNGDMLLASDSGLIAFTPDRLLKDRRQYRFLLREKARNVYIDSRQTIWVGTADNGLFVKEHGGKQFRHYTRGDGLPGSTIQFVTCVPAKANGGEAVICIGTQNGVCWTNLNCTRFYRDFYFNDPLRSFCNESSYALLDDGRFAVGTLNGIVIFNAPHNASSHDTGGSASAAIVDIVVDGASLYDDAQLMENFRSRQPMRLSHDQGNITFYFSIFDYSKRNITDFSYRLEGYEEDWTVVSAINFASYKHLKPGTYHFHLRYRNANGNWVESPQVQEIIIASPWWDTWWAYLAYTIVAGSIAFFIYRHLATTSRLRRDIAVEKQLTEYKLRFFTNISHEFRTPLTLIQGSMDRIGSLKNIPSDMRQPLSNMQRDVNRMLRLINQLLEFRRMQNNKLSLALQETDIVALLHNIWISFHDTAENANIDYRFLRQHKSLDVFVDRGFVDKIFYNLLSNAFKYTPAGGSISLAVRTDGEFLCVEVADSGIGIPKDKQQEIFERYKTGKVSADSIGIGLNLTQELVRVHHGKIRYDENPGGGSIFTVTLPIDKSAYAKEDFMATETPLGNKDIEMSGFTPQYREAAIQPMNDKSILIVDDTVEIAAMVAGELGKYFHVATAKDGQEAWEMLNGDLQGRVDLVVSDIRMPRLGGYDLTRKIRHSDRLKALPVILLTSLTDDSEHARGLDVGADAFITKPFNVEVLISQCANIIRQRDILRKAFASAQQPQPVLKNIIKDDKDLRFAKRLESLVEANLKDAAMSVDTLAEQFDMGRTSFYNKVKSITGKTPNEYITEKRMNRARQLLEQGRMTVSQVSAETGFSSPQYFARNFKKFFGQSPSEVSMRV